MLDAKSDVKAAAPGKLDDFPYKTKMNRSAYEQEKAALQVELLKVQHWFQETGQ